MAECICHKYDQAFLDCSVAAHRNQQRSVEHEEIITIDMAADFFKADTGFRGLWFTRRSNGKVMWTVTYLDAEREYVETEEWETWMGAVQDARERIKEG